MASMWVTTNHHNTVGNLPNAYSHDGPKSTFAWSTVMASIKDFGA